MTKPRIKNQKLNLSIVTCVALSLGATAEENSEETKPSQVDHSQHKMVDHSKHKMMDHSAHKKMNHSAHKGMDHNMSLDDEGMVMNSNENKLPKDCSEISESKEITVKAGTEFSLDYPGTVFGMDQHEVKIKPCSKLTVTFINEDEVRHQWMVHGLPKYLYDKGMFHLEASGGAKKTGSLIVPSDDKTYLVHCDIAQHMEKGMKAQLVVGKGSGDLPSIPGISADWSY